MVGPVYCAARWCRGHKCTVLSSPGDAGHQISKVPGQVILRHGVNALNSYPGDFHI